MEFDLARLRGIPNAAAFATALRDICRTTLTNDYWTITLPTDLATSAARRPSMFAYFAALNLHEARALFSQHKVSDLMDPVTQGDRSALERHHLFPKAYLNSIGFVSDRDTNQIANYTMIEWGDNAEISQKSPNEYLPEYKIRFGGYELQQMYYSHALPDNWEQLE